MLYIRGKAPVALFCKSDSLSLQAFEVQPGTGLPHAHGVGWRKDVGEATLSTLEFLQKERHTLRLEPDKAQPVLQLAAEAYAVTLRADKLRAQFPLLTDEQAKEAVALARRLQLHRCTATCAMGTRDGELCSHFFPRVPSLYDHLQLSGPWGNDAEKRWTLECQEFVLSVKRAIENHAARCRLIPPHTLLLELLKSISDGPATAVLDNKFYFCGVQFDDCAWFRYHLRRTTDVLPPGVPQADVLTLAAYHYLTSIGKRHSRIVSERLMDECEVVSYSPWVLLATKSSTNIELITHSPSTVCQYLTKGSGGVDSLVRSADEVDERQTGAGRRRLRTDRLDSETASVLRRQADVLGRREAPLCELLFTGLDPRLSLVKRRDLPARVLSVRTHRHINDSKLVATNLKANYGRRPLQVDHLTLVEYAMWYYVDSHGEDVRFARRKVPSPVHLTWNDLYSYVMAFKVSFMSPERT